jgi:hydroxycarboxylate dehydrogenase B
MMMPASFGTCAYYGPAALKNRQKAPEKAPMSARFHHFNPTQLENLVHRMFSKAGWPDADCKELAAHLVLANLSGHDSHGIGMVPTYVDAFHKGWLLPGNAPKDLVALDPFLVIDARVTLGQTVAAQAVSRASEMALRHGVAILNLINAHHIGRVGHYAEQAAEAGLISLFWVNVAVQPARVAPFGGREARFGTNPHTVGLPLKKQPPIILDFATSRMAMGKARVAMNKGMAAPEGFLIDSTGQPTTDPSVVFKDPFGALLTFGDHKGSGIAIVAELLSAALAGGATVNSVEANGAILNSMLGILIDPNRLGPAADERDARMVSYIEHVKSAAPRDEGSRVMMPGEPERLSRRQRLQGGIPVDAETWAQMVAAATSLGLDAEAVVRT